ncbi:MAG TPA: DMT family transporter [Ignavibacteriaceae bacterium]|nr:DMT family transporter [Ignavibacteriaceae bacterium]
MKKKLVKYWKPLAAVVFWGASFIATKTALSELRPTEIILVRLFFGSLLLLFISLLTKRNLLIGLKGYIGILILALVAVFHLWIQVTGLQFTTASNTGWIIGTSPVFMALIGYFFFDERFTLVKASGIIIAFAGLILLISRGNLNNLDFITNKGDFLILASAATWSIYSAVNKRIALDYPPLIVTLFLFIMMGLILMPFTLSGKFFSSILSLSLRGWISVLFLGLLCSGVAYVLWAQSLKEMETVKVGAFLYFEPFVTVFAAWLLLNEKITFLIILSGLIITFGVILVNLDKMILKRKF